MNKIYLSKSSYCNAVQCKKILWLDEFKKDCVSVEDNSSVLAKGREVGEFAKGLFGDYNDVPSDENIISRIKKTQDLLLDRPNVITEASFSFDNNFCSVDILKNDLDGVKIYEVKGKTKFEDINLDDPAFQYFILSNLGLNVKSVSVIYLNNEYVRGKELDIHQLFNIKDITDYVKQKQDEIRQNIDNFNDFMHSHGKDDEPITDIGNHCFSPYSCNYWKYCTRDLPKPNVFDIAGMKRDKKFEKYYEGKFSFEDLENDGDITNPKYIEQIDFEVNNREPKIETEAIRNFLSSLRYPLYFIDYEACQYAIPKYEGTKTYQQIPFQYSLHIIEEDGAPLNHKEFLAEIDDENMIRNFAESMIKDLPQDGSVIVYNKTFEESLVNKKLAVMFPDLKEEIDRINGNIVDIMVPFRKRNYYTREMKGSFSIKKVLPALYPDDAELDYSNLEEIHNGSEASDAFLSLKDKTPEEQEEIRQALLEYCKLDTYAMVKIWEKFKEIVN